MVSNAREAIKLAKDVMNEAGYSFAKIIEVVFDEDEELWDVTAQSGQTEINMSITADGEVESFTTD